MTFRCSIKGKKILMQVLHVPAANHHLVNKGLFLFIFTLWHRPHLSMTTRNKLPHGKGPRYGVFPTSSRAHLAIGESGQGTLGTFYCPDSHLARFNILKWQPSSEAQHLSCAILANVYLASCLCFPGSRRRWPGRD